MKSTLRTCIIGSVTASAIGIATATGAHGAGVPQTQTASASAQAQVSNSIAQKIAGQDRAGLQQGLEFISSIPDSALTSQAAYEAWLKENAPAQERGPVSCGIAITAAVASNVFAVTKILKVKAAIKAAGGAKKFATKAIDAYNKAKDDGKTTSQAISAAAREGAGAGGEDVVNAILDIFSVNAVLKDCFGVDL